MICTKWAKAGARAKNQFPQTPVVSASDDRGQNFMNFPVYRLKIGPFVAELFNFKVFDMNIIWHFQRVLIERYISYYIT